MLGHVRQLRLRAIGAAMLLAATAGLASGCANGPGISCADPRAATEVIVHVVGAGAAVVYVEVCTDKQCAPRDGSLEQFGGLVHLHQDGTTWTFQAFAWPKPFDLRAFAADGREVARATVRPVWKPTDPAAPCPGGPAVAELTFKI
jgi:hypothetical protein